MKRYIAVIGVAVCIVHSLVVPDFPVWVWFQNPTFPFHVWAPLLLGLVVVSFVYSVLRNAKYDGDVIHAENARRAKLEPDDYKLDKNRGSFYSVTKSINMYGEPTDVEMIPKPPDVVPSYYQRVKNNLKRAR